MAYSRTYVHRIDQSVSNQRAFSPGYAWSNYGTQSTTTVSLDGSRSGSTLTGWREKIQRGLSAATVFDSDRTRVIRMVAASGSSFTNYRNYVPDGFGGRTYTYSNYMKTRWQCHPFSMSKPTHGSIAASDAGAKALSKILAMIRKEQNQWSGGTALGELRESIRMLRKPFASLVDAINNQYVGRLRPITGAVYRRRNSRRRGETQSETAQRQLSDVNKVIRDLWLETSFGWRPLISDVRDAAEAVARYHDEAQNKELKRIVRLQGSGRYIPVSPPFSDTYWKASDPEGQTCRLKRWSDHTVKYVVGYIREENVGKLDSSRLLQLLGFDWSQFVPTVWNLLPWSFLADYFVGIGNFLENTFTCTDAVAWISRTDRLVTTDSYTSVPRGQWDTAGPDSTTAYANRIGAHVVLRRTTIARTVPVTLGVPPLTITNPFGSAVKTANMLALWSKVQSDLSATYTKASDRKRRW